MIVVNIDVMLAKRKMSVTELSEAIGITMANVSILKNGRAKAIRIETLDKICRALQCQPGRHSGMARGRRAMKLIRRIVMGILALLLLSGLLPGATHSERAALSRELGVDCTHAVQEAYEDTHGGLPRRRHDACGLSLFGR